MSTKKRGHVYKETGSCIQRNGVPHFSYSFIHYSLLQKITNLNFFTWEIKDLNRFYYQNNNRI